MSLDAAFEKLSIGDEASIIEKVKAEGVEKSGFASNIDVLKAKCASKDEAEALAGLATAKAVAEGCPEAEAFNKECLTACKCPILESFRLESPAWSLESITESLTFHSCFLQVSSRLFPRVAMSARLPKRLPMPFAKTLRPLL